MSTVLALLLFGDTATRNRSGITRKWVTRHQSISGMCSWGGPAATANGSRHKVGPYIPETTNVNSTCTAAVRRHCDSEPQRNHSQMGHSTPEYLRNVLMGRPCCHGERQSTQSRPLHTRNDQCQQYLHCCCSATLRLGTAAESLANGSLDTRVSQECAHG